MNKNLHEVADMDFPRASGILLHITSLPGRYGIGSLGREAYRFADFLASAGQRLWQILPISPSGPGNSPYQCPSVFAGNPLLIGLEELVSEGLLDTADLRDAPPFSESGVDYNAVTRFKLPLLQKSAHLFEQKAAPAQKREFESFCQQNAFWLDDYALFMALREAQGLTLWNTWPEDIRRREPDAMRNWSEKLNRQIKGCQYQQYQFFRQWFKLRDYCHRLNIKIIGDIPIFVAPDSAEVWSHPGMFYLDDTGYPTVVSGVPPDYFSETGQFWGNPIYRWDVLARDGYAWWIARFRMLFSLVDIVRIDHFRGFESYWEISANEKTAINGHWVPGPGAGFFETVESELGKLPIIAEDLGVITPEVEALRDRFGFPGMKVLQFAFSGGNQYLQHNYIRNCVVYTGTHDNDTTLGWLHDCGSASSTQNLQAKEAERRRALAYVGTDGREINWDFIRLAFMSVANTAIVPLQDVLGLGCEARMNTPSRAEGNWCWRFRPEMLSDAIRDRLRDMTILYERTEKSETPAG
jgi:4-alpha-glucanotransferase